MPIERLLIILVSTLVMLNSCVNCDCGRPHRPAFGSFNRKHVQRFKEDSVVTYSCNNSYRLVHDARRVCKLGVWSGKPPVCAKPIIHGIWPERVLIYSETDQEVNISVSFTDDQYMWKAINEESCVSYSSKPQNWTIVLSRAVIVNYLAIKLQSDVIINKTDLAYNIKAFVNKHRTCSLLKFNAKTFELEFICHSLSALKSKLEEKDKRDTIQLYFNLSFSAPLTICGIGLYRFPKDCGKIGSPLQTTIDEVDEGLELEASCEDGYELVGSSRVFCGSDGHWIGSPACKPIVTCPLIAPITKYDEKVVRIEYKNVFYFNRTLMAVEETDAIHYCTKTNVTKITNNSNNNITHSRYLIKYNRVCENGVWSEVETDCDTLLIDNGLANANGRSSIYLPILITIFVTFLIFCVLSAFSYYFCKIKIKAQQQEQQINQVKSAEPLVKLSRSHPSRFSYSSNRTSDPFDDSVYAIVAEETYDIINFDGNRFSPGGQYDDVETSRPFYLEIVPLENGSHEHKTEIVVT